MRMMMKRRTRMKRRTMMKSKGKADSSTIRKSDFFLAKTLIIFKKIKTK